MPIREYKCKCGWKKDVLWRGHDTKVPAIICENCKEWAGLVQISQSSFRLVGDGWAGKEIKAGK